MPKHYTNILDWKGIILFLLLPNCLGIQVKAQEVKTHKKSESLTELVTYAPGSRKIKDGVYKVMDANNKTLVIGYYRQDKKVGIWNYFNPNGVLVQRYDYSNDSLLMNNNHDEGTLVKYSFEIPDAKIPANTDVTPPVKIGGNNYGFYLLYDIRQIPIQVRNEIATTRAVMNYEFTIGPDGKLESWDISYLDSRMDKEITKNNLSIKHLPEDAYTFIPAKLNGRPVRSKLVYTIPLVVEENNTQKVGSAHNMMTNN